MITDPTNPAAVTDFDLDNPVVIRWGHRSVKVFRSPAVMSTAPTEGAVPTPRLVLEVDGIPHPIRALQADDTRESIERTARVHLAQYFPEEAE
jgi:hypothetical protein